MPSGEPGGTLRRSPLDERHREAGARMSAFGGWEMPLSYRTGTVAEHLACRSSAAIFDVSHLGTIRVEGPAAHETLQSTLTNDLAKIDVGRAQYTHLLDADGSVLDDLIVWWRETDLFDVMPNAANTERVVDALHGTDVTDTRAVLAVQGPAARSLVASVLGSGPAGVGPFRLSAASFAGTELTVAGTGYTGEDGVEVAVAPEQAGALWDSFVAAGAVPAGLGARDTLRLEAALPLHGNELGPGITPLQAGLGWVVGWAKPSFRGREAVVAERERGPARRLRGLVAEGRRPPRAGYAVLADGQRVGTVTSGNFSPVLERGIALALIDEPAGRPGGEASWAIRGRGADQPCEPVETPFVARGSTAS